MCENKCDDCNCDDSCGENCEDCYPLVEPQPVNAKPVMIEAWLYHPDIMNQIGDYCIVQGRLHIVTKKGLEPYV
jgi:hypothetical protein